MCLFFFFFKQKTAYEMRISDWSSDMCSSDLQARNRAADVQLQQQQLAAAGADGNQAGRLVRTQRRDAALHLQRLTDHGAFRMVVHAQLVVAGHQVEPGHRRGDHRPRSEEHTSELQSLMRISYAVFCLKKKKHA